MNHEVHNLDELLDNLDETVPGEHRVRVSDLMQALGQRSFAPTCCCRGSSF